VGTGVSPLVGLSRVTCSRVSVQEAGDTSSLPYARPGHSGRIATMEAGDLFTLLYRVPEIVTLLGRLNEAAGAAVKRQSQ
jgi:hypothetical protein